MSAREAGLSAEHLGGGRRGGDAEARPPSALEACDGGAEGGGLAGAGRADDEDQRLRAGHGCGGFALGPVEASPATASGSPAPSSTCGVRRMVEDARLPRRGSLAVVKRRSSDRLGHRVGRRARRSVPAGPAAGEVDERGWR